MRLKRLGAALLVAAAISVVIASNAFAAVAETLDVKWYTGSSPGTELTGSASLKSHSAGGSFTTKVSGETIALNISNIECVECEIKNESLTAVGSGKLKFTGVTVSQPAGCTISPSITTETLKLQADWMRGTTNYWRFAPFVELSGKFMQFELAGSGCPVTTAIAPRGTVFFRTVSATGTQQLDQSMSTSEGENILAGGTLHVGAETASFFAFPDFELSSGARFGTH